MNKSTYKIGEVSRMTGLAAYVLRFWESEFPSLRPQKNRGNQRRYTQDEIDAILEIKKLLYEERLTIEGARKRLRGEEGEKGSFDSVSPAPLASELSPVTSTTTSGTSEQTSDGLLLWVREEVNHLHRFLIKSGRSAAR
jgi:DNA-binding transcriptional MerR regulator